MAKLYPPQLEGTIPAFYKTYSNDGKVLMGATMTIPFGLNSAVNMTSIKKIALKLRTVSTSTYVISNFTTSSFNLDEGWATFNFYYNKDSTNGDELIAGRLNEGQYYRAQLAFVGEKDEIGYYSTVGIIKCIAKPTVEIPQFTAGIVNSISKDYCIGSYLQDTSFGDSTEKVYSYSFNLWDENDNIILTTGEVLHDVTQDTLPYESKDYFNIYTDLVLDKIYRIQYTVTTLNGLVISTEKYKIMKTISIDTEFPIKLHGQPNNEQGYIHLTLKGDIVTYQAFGDENTTITGEATGNAAFVIKRACNQDNYNHWQEIIRFALNGIFPSEYSFNDFTVEQGFKYKYALYQYNIHNIVSNKVPMTYGIDKRDSQGVMHTYSEIDDEGITHAANETDGDGNYIEKEITIDFEDMFLFDGERQLKVRFNPKITSFQETIPEQKIETIGSKYPYIFRNGIVNYKEFPIGGLISFQEDEELYFLTTEDEVNHAGVLENAYVRSSRVYTVNQSIAAHETRFRYTGTTRVPIVDAVTGKTSYKIVAVYDDATKLNNGKNYIINENSLGKKVLIHGEEASVGTNVRTNKDLTSQNIMSERYFKLKVLDWLANGKVKLFRSPTEGMYLVRLLNVKLTPEEALGRMIHNFTCMAYEIAEVNYDNLVAYGIIHPETPSLYELQYDSVPSADLFSGTVGEDGFYQVPLNSTTITGLDLTDFAPGDQIKITYNDSGVDNTFIYTIGITGTLNFNNDDRTIAAVGIKPNPDTNDYNDFGRSFIYTTTGLRLSKFDVVSNVQVQTQVAEQFVGPKENLLEAYNLRSNAYGILDAETGLTERTISDENGIQNIYDDLKNRNHISYQLGNDVPKITGYKIDILQVHKREVVPIFARGNIIDNNTIFDVTPFGQPYIPNGLEMMSINEKEEPVHGVYDISNYTDENNIINYADGSVLSVTPYEFYGGVNINDIYPLLVGINPKIDHFTIFKTFIRDNDGNWVEPETHKYFDTYTGEWWDDEEEYDPTFRINEIESIENLPISNDNGEHYGTYSLYDNKGIKNTYKVYENDELNVTWTDLNGEVHTLEGTKPAISIASNNIRLAEIENMTLYNLGAVNQIHLGNGVYAEITIEVRVVDYDIEDSNEGVKSAKEAYLKAKDEFAETLKNVHTNAAQINDALAEKAELEAQLKLIQDSLDAYEGSYGVLDSVIEMVQNRIIAQKEHIYDDTKTKLLELIEILRSLNLPDRINEEVELEDWKNPALDIVTFYDEKEDDGYVIVDLMDGYHGDYTYYILNEDEEYVVWSPSGSTDEEKYEAWMAQVLDGLYIFVDHPLNTYTSNLYNTQRKQLQNIDRAYDDRDLELYDSETLEEKIASFNYIYLQQQQDKLDKNKDAKEDAKEQVKLLQQQIGNLAGGYSDIGNDDGGYAPDTLAYYDDLIEKQEALQDTLTNKYNEELEKLNNAILEAKQAILYATLAGENDDLLDQYTDQYILDNVNALRERLATLIDAVNNDLDTLDNRFVADLKDILPEYEYIKIDPTSEYNEDYTYYQLDSNGQYVEYVYNADNWENDNNNLYVHTFVDYGYKYSRVPSGTVYDENTTYYTRTTDDEGKEAYNEYTYDSSTWVATVNDDPGLYTKVRIENDNKDLNQNKVQAVKDYLTEYNAITKDHVNDTDWLKNHFVEMMDRFMVQVKKE